MRANSFFLLLLLVFLSGSVVAQIDIKRYTTATDTFYWKRYEHVPKPKKLNLKPFMTTGAKKAIDSFLSKNLSLFPQFTNDSISRFGINDLKKCLFPVDINGDRLPDIIFSGFSGGEADVVRIFINRGDRFEFVFEDYQYITRFKLTNGKLTDMQTADPGCCDGYLYFTREYLVNQDSTGPVFIKGKQTVIYKYTEEPRTYFPSPKAFRAKSDTLMVRASAARLNEPFNPYLDTFGNIVAKYRTKARGMALAKKTDEKGNKWFFVEIYPDTSPSASILYETEKIPTFLRGWVSGNRIEFN
ncbi:MAG: hypothetical protein M0Q38_16405 [Bacteroidales bacterium]|jgi:hypothetical protein|nr:hypothetical protein [Bacteroidales bacterium]